MPARRLFARLSRDQIEVLFSESSQPLRRTYIEILTLLQDILGHHGSQGNSTVFRKPGEAERLLYEALSKIDHFRTSLDDDSEAPLLKNRLGAKLVELTLEVEGGRSPDFVVGKPSKDIVGRLLLRTSTKARGKDRIELLHNTPAKTLYIKATVAVDRQGGVLSIYEQDFLMRNFTFARFIKALGIRKPATTNALQVYEKLMKDIGVDTRSKRTKTVARDELLEGLRKTILSLASQNVVGGLSLKAHCESGAKQLVGRLGTVDQFLEDLLREYQLLRKPMIRRRPPTPMSKQKGSNKTTRRHISKEH
jgi:hypothetical protein